MSENDATLKELQRRWSAETFGDIDFPEHYVFSLKAQRGNFFSMVKGLAFDDHAKSALGNIIELAGEVYQFDVQDVGTLNYLNVLETCEALDDDKTLWREESDGSKRQILVHAFQADKFTTNSGLFRMPENHYTKLLAVTGAPGQTGDFYARYHEANLTGLAFRKLWSDSN